MADLEGNAPRPSRGAAAPVENPYTAEPSLPQNELLEKAKRILYIAVSWYGLEHFKFYGVIMRSPHVSREWFKVGLATTIGELVFVYMMTRGAHMRSQSEKRSRTRFFKQEK